MNTRHNLLIHSGLSEKTPTPIGYVVFSDKTTVNQNLTPGIHVQLRFLGLFSFMPLTAFFE